SAALIFADQFVDRVADLDLERGLRQIELDALAQGLQQLVPDAAFLLKIEFVLQILPDAVLKPPEALRAVGLSESLVELRKNFLLHFDDFDLIHGLFPRQGRRAEIGGKLYVDSPFLAGLGTHELLSEARD